MRRGRKPAGPRLVEGLSGSSFAKKRLQEILRTIAGETTIEDACAELNISRSRFFELRQSALASLVEHLEPRPAGRPPEEPEESEDIAELRRQNARLKLELEASRVRAELNTFLPLVRPKKNDR